MAKAKGKGQRIVAAKPAPTLNAASLGGFSPPPAPKLRPRTVPAVTPPRVGMQASNNLALAMKNRKPGVV